MARRIIGKVSRFGPRGFGFIESRELDRAAWFALNLTTAVNLAARDDVE